jgi:hypothetical protein
MKNKGIKNKRKIQDWSREKQRREQKGKHGFAGCKKVEATKNVS